MRAGCPDAAIYLPCSRTWVEAWEKVWDSKMITPKSEAIPQKTGFMVELRGIAWGGFGGV